MLRHVISVVIPARNEERSIALVIEEVRKYADEVIVVDDGSTDGTRASAEGLGATVVANELRGGYIGAIKTGFRHATGDIVVTLDADGEHDPHDMPVLLKPIIDDQADLVLGRRPEIPRVSERLINWLTNFRVNVGDSGTGYRAMKRELAVKLALAGKCTCGVLVLEAHSHGATIAEVPIGIRAIAKRRSVAWAHWQTIALVLLWLAKNHSG